MPNRDESADRTLFRLLLDLTEAVGESLSTGVAKTLGKLSRQIGADLLYTVLPDGQGWTKEVYGPEGHKGSQTMQRPTGIVRHVLSKRSRFLQTRLTSRDPFHRHQDGWPGLETSSYLAVPIHRHGQARGVLVFLRGPQRSAFDLEDISRAELVADALAVRAVLAERFGDLESLARTDGLTQLPNYRSAREILARELRLGRQFATAVAILIVEVEGIGGGNGRFDFHAQGALLSRVGQLLRRTVRGTDHVACLGGNEFLVVLPGTDREGAACVAKRIEEAVAGEIDPSRGAAGVRCACAGACFPEDAADDAALITAASRSLSDARSSSSLDHDAGDGPLLRRAA